jgi:hypothetical protein
MSFATYKKNRTDLTKINKRVEEISEGNKNKFKDSRFWKPTVDKAGTGSAKIRFLPAPEGEDLPWIQYYEHNFDVDGNYYIELCPTTLGRECPVCKANGVLWKTELDENRNIVKKRKRQLRYVSNILVLKDKETPENEDKVFLYQYGQKIFEKIKGALKPKDEEDPAINVFDFWEGADFNLDIKKVAGYRNYDDSKFRTSSLACSGDETKMEKIYKQLYKLQPFVEESKFKSYEELEKKFNDTVNGVKGKIQKKADELFGETKLAEDVAKKSPSKNAKEEKETKAPWEEAVRKPSKKKKEITTDSEVVVENEDSLNDYEKLLD